MRVFYKFILPIRPHNVLANKRMKIPLNKSLILPFKHSRIDNYISLGYTHYVFDCYIEYYGMGIDSAQLTISKK